MMRMLTPSRAVWLALGAVYALFWLWYTGPGGTLKAEEIDELMVRVRTARPSDPALQERFRSFAENDDGRPFYVVNLVRGGGLGKGMRPWIDRKAGLGQLRNLLSRAGHPVAGGAIESNLMEQGLSPDGAATWDRVMLVRYRSRRDFLEGIQSEQFAEHARRNSPQFDEVVKAIAMPTPGLAVGPRGVLFLLLLIAGLLAQLVLTAPRPDPAGLQHLDRSRAEELGPRIAGALPVSWGKAFTFAWSLLWRTAVLAFLPTAIVAILSREWTGPIVVVEQFLRLAVALSALALASRWVFRGLAARIDTSRIEGATR